MSEQATFDISYTAPQRVREAVQIDETISHIDVLLPHSQESYIDGFRWVSVLQKALRIHHINERSMMLSDLSSIEGNHSSQAPVLGTEDALPTVVVSLGNNKTTAHGRDHNPGSFEILSDRLISREHLKITPRLGETGLTLALVDEFSTNGSGLSVVRHRLDTPDSLFAA